MERRTLFSWQATWTWLSSGTKKAVLHVADEPVRAYSEPSFGI